MVLLCRAVVVLVVEVEVVAAVIDSRHGHLVPPGPHLNLLALPGLHGHHNLLQILSRGIIFTINNMI